MEVSPLDIQNVIFCYAILPALLALMALGN